MTACPRCGEVKVVLDHTKNGAPYLRNYGANHGYTCPSGNWTNPKKKAKAPKKPGVDPETRAMVVKNWGKAQAEELLPHAKGETLEDQFLSVLHYINNKGGA